MKVTNEKTENNQAFLTIEMEPEEMNEAIEASYHRLARKANIPGFRKGKAPRAVLERHIGRDRVLDEAIQEIVPEAYEKAIKEQQINPIAQPSIEIVETEPVKFKAVVPLPPTVELGDYRGVRLTAEPVETTDDNVQAVLEELRHQYATWESVDRPVDFNDLVVMNIDSEAEEKPFVKRLGVQYQVVRDSVAPAPGFAEQLVGMGKGEEKEFKLTLPDNYAQSEFAGKEVSFKIKVEDIKEEHMPEMNDALAKQVSAEFETVDALREQVAKNLKERAEERARVAFENRVIDAALEVSKVSFPPVMVESEIDRLISERSRQMQLSGQALDDYLRSINKTGEQLREELRQPATKNVTVALVLGKVSDEEKIAVTDADVDARIDSMVAGLDEKKKSEMQAVLNNPQMRESVKRSLLTEKTVERLVEIAGGGTIKTEVKEEQS